MKVVMTLSAIQTPILIIGSFLVLFLGLSALGGGSIATGWTCLLYTSGSGKTYQVFRANVGSKDCCTDNVPGFSFTK